GRGKTAYGGDTCQVGRGIVRSREGLADGFTRKHGVKRLVYFEVFGDIRDAIVREKQLKKWNRDWKIRLIEEQNPRWEDLFPSLTTGRAASSDCVYVVQVNGVVE